MFMATSKINKIEGRMQALEFRKEMTQIQVGFYSMITTNPTSLYKKKVRRQNASARVSERDASETGGPLFMATPKINKSKA